MGLKARVEELEKMVEILKKPIWVNEEKFKKPFNWTVTYLDNGKFGWMVESVHENLRYSMYDSIEEIEAKQEKLRDRGEVDTYPEARKEIVNAIVARQLKNWFEGNQVGGQVWV